MKKFVSIIMTISLTIGTAGEFYAQDIDLSEQRGEEQSVAKVPGYKVENNGISVNPVPREIIKGNSFVSIADGLKLTANSNDLSRISDELKTAGFKISKNGIPIKVTQDKAAEGVQPVDGAYKLEIDADGININSLDARGTFYAIQTLRKLVTKANTLPLVTIIDYPNMGIRGLVEGFYGNPWSHDTRLSLIEFLGANKMNTYIYGPKDDPYHSSPYWRLEYPETQAKQIKELIDKAKKNHVRFVWAIHPGKDIRWDEEDYQNLVNKFNLMYGLGVRDFAIFFDDIEGIGTDSRRQTELLNRLTDEFVKQKGDVGNLMICPTDYSQLWASPDMENGQLAIYGKTLNPNVEVFWTGAVVCSDLTPETLQFVDSRIKRPALYWWNFPVTDYVRNIVMQGPSYGLDTSLTSNEVSGVVSNPMEHGEASKVALYGLGDYTWNTNQYNPIDSWERAIVDIMPDAAEAYRTFAIHNTDTETGYRRDESWETETFKFNDYTPEQFESLKAEFEKIADTRTQLLQASNMALVRELYPWLVEFEKLGERGLKALEIIKLYEAGDYDNFLKAYNNNLMSEQDKILYDNHKVGTMKLQPFYESVMQDIILDYNAKQAK